MLQRRQMLTAVELRLPDHVVEALIAIRDDLRDGKYPHQRLPGRIQIPTIPIDLECARGLKARFNMGTWITKIDSSLC
jgi:hypothetical protein